MVEGVKHRLAELTDQQRRLLVRRLSKRRRPGADTGIALQSRDSNTFPLSYAQQRIWFLNQFGSLNSAFNIMEAYRLLGLLDIDALRRSLNEIVRRHEPLRTTFGMVDGEPVQHVAPHLELDLAVEDLRRIPPPEREPEIKRQGTAFLLYSWNLETGPLIRAKLLRVTDEEQVLLIVVHHIVSDGWSKGVLLGELSTLYEAFSAGKPSPLPELPIQYVDFTVWQRQWLQGTDFEKQLAYWKQRMTGSATLQLPLDRSRSVKDNGGMYGVFVLPKELTEGLRALSRQEGTTLFMTMLAAFSAVLHRYSGQDDIVIGSPIANRNRAEIEDLIGCFMNPLPLRIDLSGNPGFRELLSRVRDTSLGCFAHQDVPFDALVRAVQPARNQDNAPLFQVMFLFQNFSLQPPAFSKLTVKPLGNNIEDIEQADTIEPIEITTGLVYPVALEMVEIGQTIIGCLEYVAAYQTTLSRFPGHFRMLLEGLVADPTKRLKELPLLTRAERDQVLVEWSVNRKDYPKDRCAHQLIETQVQHTPDATAVVFSDRQVTYDELNTRANQLAHHLRKLGVGPEVMVGILLERSIDMVVAVLGVLKAGGAYVPLDPMYPAERLDFILEDTRMPVVLTQESLRDKYNFHGAQAVCLDAESDVISRHSAADPHNGAGSDNLAYVIYTSGSSGRPKGTMITHGSLVNAYWAWEDAYSLRSAVRSHLQMASISFDVFTGDLVRALCSGGKLVLAPQEFLFTPEKLYALMCREKVDCAEFVPVVLRGLVEYVEQTKQSLDFMRLLIAGSDSWYLSEYRRLRSFCGPDTRVINSYGLTEATIDSTYYEDPEVDGPDDGLVPIGRPFANTETYLLDGDLQPVPIGVPAELYIGGPGLARGYLNHPELTAERFIVHPFSSAPGARLYRTGDLARFLPDGNIEFLGRADHQVKLHGFRIELGEIEAALAQHPAVDQVAVLLREDQPGDKRLVGYVVLDQEHVVTIADLRRFLHEKLPEYMVPSSVVMLDVLPLTPNGKVDRRALPEPLGRRQSEEAFVPPQNETQQKIADIWKEVLRVEKVGIHDNFFDLGGHSLLVVKVHGKLREVFDRNLSIVDLFRFPTVASLANQCTKDQSEEPKFHAVRDRAEKQKHALQRQRQLVQKAKARGT